MSEATGSHHRHRRAREAPAGPIEAALRRSAEQQPLHLVALANDGHDGSAQDDSGSSSRIARFMEDGDDHGSGAASPTKFEGAAAVRFLSQPAPATADRSTYLERMVESSDAAGFTDTEDDTEHSHQGPRRHRRRRTHSGLPDNANEEGEEDEDYDKGRCTVSATMAGESRVRHRALSQPCHACLEKQRRASTAASFAMATTAPVLMAIMGDSEDERIGEDGELLPKRRKPLPKLPPLPKGAKCMPPLERFQASPCMAVAKRARSVAPTLRPAASPLSRTATATAVAPATAARPLPLPTDGADDVDGVVVGVRVCRHCRATKPEPLVEQLMKLGMCEHTSPKTTSLRQAPDDIKLRQRKNKRPVSRVPRNYTPRVVSQPRFSPQPCALLP